MSDLRNKQQLLEGTEIFNTPRRDVEAKNRAKENKNTTCEEVEEMYKDLCKILIRNEKWEPKWFNEQPDNVKEKVWKMLKFIYIYCYNEKIKNI